jgi:hypothetical protein
LGFVVIAFRAFWMVNIFITVEIRRYNAHI